MTIKNPLNNLKADDGKLYGIYRGVVENRVDPDKLGRCQIRILGVHSELKDKNVTQGIPTEELPWAEAAMGITEGSVSGFGLWSVPLQGSHVFVFFENGNMMQPRFFASAPGLPMESPDTSKGFNDPDGNYPSDNRLKESDVHRLARGESDGTIIEHRNSNKSTGIKTAQGTWDEPDSAYATEYPDNIVLATHAGITIEVDCTPGNARLHIYHPSNSYIEIDKDGNMTVNNAKDRFDIVEGDEKKAIKGSFDRTVLASRSSYVEANETEVINGKRKSSVQGKEDVLIGADRTHTVSGTETISIGTSQSVTIGTSQIVSVGTSLTTDIGTDETKNIGTNQTVTVGANGVISYGGTLLVSASGILISSTTGGGTASMDSGGMTINCPRIELN